MSLLKKVYRLLSERFHYRVIQVSFINSAFPVMTDLSGIQSNKYDVYNRVFSKFIDACFYVASKSKIRFINDFSDVLVIEAHGTEDGLVLAGRGEFVNMNNILEMCNGTNVGTIILATCYGDRIVGKGKIDDRLNVVYNTGTIYDNDAMIAVKRMVESLEFWPIGKVVKIINNGAMQKQWIIIKSNR